MSSFWENSESDYISPMQLHSDSVQSPPPVKSNGMSQIETFHGFVETVQDALILFEACRRGVLNMVSQRLTPQERDMISSGSCFIYCEETSKIKRWTDGRLWSPSRILGSFLIYRELSYKIPQPRMEKYDKSSRKTIDLDGKTAVVGSKGTFIVKEGGMVKKTISAKLDGVDGVEGKEFHLVSYYHPHDLEFHRLETPRNVPELAMLEPHESIKLSQPSSKKRSGTSTGGPSSSSPIPEDIIMGISLSPDLLDAGQEQASSSSSKRFRTSMSNSSSGSASPNIASTPTPRSRKKSSKSRAKEPCPLSIKEWKNPGSSSRHNHKRTQSESTSCLQPFAHTRSNTVAASMGNLESSSFFDNMQFPSLPFVYETDLNEFPQSQINTPINMGLNTSQEFLGIPTSLVSSDLFMTPTELGLHMRTPRPMPCPSSPSPIPQNSPLELPPSPSPFINLSPIDTNGAISSTTTTPVHAGPRILPGGSNTFPRTRVKSEATSKLFRRHSFPIGYHQGLLTTFPDSYFQIESSP